MERRARILMMAIGAAMMLAPAAARAQPTDTAVKAAFLPRFARYVSWPAGAMPKGSDPFVLCVIGSDPFGAALDQAARSQLVDGRRIVVRRLDSAAGADACQIAFLQSAQTLQALARKPVLTVTDAMNGGPRGIVQFTIVGGRVRFFINQAAAAERGLSISSRLLALAVGVRQ
jgi:hypothetical protein